MTLPDLLGHIAELSPTDIPAVLAALAARMASVRAVEAPAEDELLDVEQAAALMGVSASWLYHRPKLPFRRQIGGKVKFSRAGIERYIRNRQSAMA